VAHPSHSSWFVQPNNISLGQNFSEVVAPQEEEEEEEYLFKV